MLLSAYSMHWVTIKQAFLVFHVIMGITRIAADAVYLVKLWDKFMRSSERLHQSAKGQRWVLTHIWLSKQSLSEGSGNLFVVFISAQYSYILYNENILYSCCLGIAFWMLFILKKYINICSHQSWEKVQMFIFVLWSHVLSV